MRHTAGLSDTAGGAPGQLVRLTAPARAPRAAPPGPGPADVGRGAPRDAGLTTTRATPPTPRAVDSRSTRVRADLLRRRTWRGARRDRGAPHACQYFTRTTAAHLRSTPGVGPAPGTTSLTRCTAAGGTCTWVLRRHADGCHLTDTPVGAAAGRASLCLVGHTLRLSQARAAAGQAAAIIRRNTRSELACDGFRCGCCTLLLYEALESCDHIFEL